MLDQGLGKAYYGETPKRIITLSFSRFRYVKVTAGGEREERAVMDVAVGASEGLFSISFIIDKLPLYDAHKTLDFLVGIQSHQNQNIQGFALITAKSPQRRLSQRSLIAELTRDAAHNNERLIVPAPDST